MEEDSGNIDNDDDDECAWYCNLQQATTMMSLKS
jgi:hypothetical protein